jgi:hypothetical protein
MFLKEFNLTGAKKIAKINKMLREEFGVSLKTTGFPRKAKLDSLLESANNFIIQLKGSHKKFQLEPEYAKYLGIKDVVETMIAEGQYAESEAYTEMKSMISASVKNLMDSGYTVDEACTECMNQFRMDNRFAYDDEHVLPIVIKASKEYMESCGALEEVVEEEFPETNSDLNEYLLRELAKECGVELSDATSYDAIEEKLNMFSAVSGKSRDTVVGFLNGLEEDSVSNGIKMFGAKVAEQNKFTGSRQDAIDAGEEEFEVGGKKFKVTGEEVKEAGMFDDILGEMISEEVDVEQAEVIMAVRALADDIQDQVERIGRMMNEDVPAIADQMRSEMGAQTAQAFADSINGVLAGYIDAAKGAKAGVDQATATVTGEETLAGGETGLGDTAELGAEAPADDLGLDTALDTNEPAMAGPEDEPLGRTPVEV